MKNICKWYARAVLGAVILIAGFSSAGCDHSLFGQDDKENENKLSYFENGSSAHQDREDRRQDQAIGFGYPSGPGGQ